ncbi:MAG: class I SAM-dependent methyltransferase [bacterium]
MKYSLVQSILQQVKDNYNICAEEFSKTRFYNWEEIKNLADKYAKNGMRILDVGCGNGRLSELFSDKELNYFGIDNSEKLIEEAKKKLEIRANFIIGDVLELPFRENEFDIIFCIAVLHHIPSKALRKKAMIEMGRVLKPGGILIMTNWNLWQDKYRKYILCNYVKLRGIENKTSRKYGRMDFGDIMLPPFSGKGVVRYHHAFTKWGLRKMFSEADFKVRECYYEKNGVKTGWRDGANLVCAGEKQSF